MTSTYYQLVDINNNTHNKTLKVILLGDASVGKTSLRSQFIHHVFTNAYRATIGGDYLTTSVNGTNLQVWDTAGQERFDSITRTFYRGCDIAVLVYDITNSDSFHHLNKWIKDFIENCYVAKPGILIVGNKADKHQSRQISLRQAREYASENIDLHDLIEEVKLDVVEITAKNYLDVEKLFLRVTEVGLKRLDENQSMLNFDNIDITNDFNASTKKYGCC